MTSEIDAHLPLHYLELRILMVLLDGPSYGTRIVERIEASEAHSVRLYPANLYRRIRDLLRKELLEEADPPPNTDPRRTYVRVTDLGRRVAAAEAVRLRGLVEEAVRHRLLPGS